MNRDYQSHQLHFIQLTLFQETTISATRTFAVVFGGAGKWAVDSSSTNSIQMALLNWCLNEEMLREAWSQSISHETVNQDLPLSCDSVSQEANRRWLLAVWSSSHGIASRLAPPDVCTETERKQDGRPAGEAPCCSCFFFKAWLASGVLRRCQRGSRHLWPGLHTQRLEENKKEQIKRLKAKKELRAGKRSTFWVTKNKKSTHKTCNYLLQKRRQEHLISCNAQIPGENAAFLPLHPVSEAFFQTCGSP